MKISAIDFPNALLTALRDSKLVVFAGAGVSMGEPAYLPNFKDLANSIAQGTGEASQEHEPEDRFLGRLSHKGVDVHALAAEKLKKNDLGETPKPTRLHRDLLRLYAQSGAYQSRHHQLRSSIRGRSNGRVQFATGGFRGACLAAREIVQRDYPYSRNCEPSRRTSAH